MALSQEQLGGGLNADLKVTYDAATGGYYVLRNGLLVPVPYYEAVISTWVAGGKITVTHALGVVPRFVQFMARAKTTIGNLTAGLQESITEVTTSTTTYNCQYRKETTTTIEVGVGQNALLVRGTGELSSGAIANNTIADLVVKVFGV